MLATQIKLIICGINYWIAWENKFFKALTSPTTLASIFPTGLLSKKSKDKYWIWLYNSCLILTKILLVMLVIIFHLILDNTQAIKFNDREKLIQFCKGIQKGSPIDSYVECEPWAMPGYNDEVIMAAGAFIQGSSIELSADAPIREPYIAYLQGGLTFDHAKIGILISLNSIL